MRLNKFLSGAGVASRRHSDELIKQGKICVNGKAVTEMGFEVNEKKDIVTFDGSEVKLPSSFVYYKFNKPRGYVCTASDEKGRKTIFDLIKSDVRLFSIGRLDYDTEGLLLLTNDGEFANKIAHPSFHIEKEYRVTIEGMVLESEMAVLRNGVVVDGERMPSAKIKWLSYEKGFTKLSVVIDEGQNRQIRRMFEAINRSIKLLKRVRIGRVSLGGLPRGEIKQLKAEEIKLLLEEM